MTNSEHVAVLADERAVEDDPLKRICNLCGYRIGKHVVPTYGTWAETPTGLWCPTDARLKEKALPEIHAAGTKQ